MKNKVQKGNWKYHTRRVFVGAFLPALATYLSLYFLFSIKMNPFSASWLAFFVCVCVWSYCARLMGYTTPQPYQSSSDDEGWLDKYKPYEPCRFDDDYAKTRPLSSQDYRSPADPAHPNNWANPYDPSAFNYHHPVDRQSYF